MKKIINWWFAPAKFDAKKTSNETSFLKVQQNSKSLHQSPPKKRAKFIALMYITFD